MKIWLLLVTFFLFFEGNSQHINTSKITVNEGLLSNYINKTFVDSQGNLWLGSRAGLVKKNMLKYELVQQTNIHKFNNIYDITEDAKNGMWIAGYGQGIIYFNKKNNTLINTQSGLVSNYVRTLKPIGNKVYVGTLNGISIINTDDFSIQNPKFTSNQAHDFTIFSFFQINNKVYATTLNDGIYEVTPTQLIKVSDLKKAFSSFVKGQHVFIGTDKDLLKLNASNFSVIEKFDVGNVWQFIEIKSELYFISSGVFDNDGGIYKLNNNKLDKVSEHFKIEINDLKSISYDPEKSFIYFGTETNGLIQTNINSPVFHQNQLNHVYTSTILNDKQFAFSNSGLTILQNNKITKNISLKDFKQFQENSIKNLSTKILNQLTIENHFFKLDDNKPVEKIIFYNSEIHENSIWVSSNVGVFELSLQGNFKKHLPIHVFYFTFFNKELITAVPYAGVRIFNDVNKFSYKYYHDWKNENIPAEIIDIVKTENAVYFASALSGLYEFKNGKFKSLLKNKVFNEAKIKRITTAGNGNLIVVTDFNDVFVLDVSLEIPKVIKQISNKKIKGSSTSFVEEIEGNLFIGTNLGINVFRNDAYYFIDNEQGFNNYNSISATVSNQILYVNTTRGYYSIANSYFNNQHDDKIEASVSKIYINNVLQDYNFLDNNENQIFLSHNQNNLRIYFSLNQVKFPNKLQFKYRLKESEPWNVLAYNNVLQLNYLNQGTYKIELQITNEDNGVQKTQTLLVLTVKPPFYLTFPFILGFVLVFLFIGFLAYKARIKYLNDKQKRALVLIELQNEQDKKQLIFDKKLANVELQVLKSQMNSHFLFNVLSSIQYFIISKDVDNALYYLERFSQLIRNTLEYSDQKTISIYEELQYLKHYIEIENLRAEHEILFIVDIDKSLNTSALQIAPLLLQPFVENSIVHAFTPENINPKITFKLEIQDDYFKITLSDNGIGYQEMKSKTHKSKGISIVKTRLQLTQQKLKDAIEIESTSSGTFVTILLENK